MLPRLTLAACSLLLLVLLPSQAPAQRDHDHLPNFGPQADRAGDAKYIVDMHDGSSRRFAVTSSFLDRPGHETVVELPVWSMGSYLVREYAKNVSEVNAVDSHGRQLPVEKIAKNRWRVTHDPGPTITLSYYVYGGELTVRTPYLTSLRAAWQATSLFMYPQGEELGTWTIDTIVPEGWSSDVIATRVEGESNRWTGTTLDRFYDTVGIAGPLTTWSFSNGGLPHRMTFDGDGNHERESLLPLIEAGFSETASLFDPDLLDRAGPSPALPIDDYGVLVSLDNDGGGGLEHFRGTLVLWDRWSFASQWDRLRFLTLAVHEYFHLWNIKHIRPDHLHDIQWDRENYVRNLFEIEGMTSYYDILLSGRAVAKLKGDPADWTSDILKLWEREIHSQLGTPGRHVENLREASFDAWVKFYRRDENSANTSISYYRKGALVTALLDAGIRDHSDGAKSLDDVWRYMWQQYLTTREGYDSPDGFMNAIRTVTGYDASDFYDRYVDGTDPLPYKQWLEPLGLELSDPDSAAWLGASFAPDGDRVMLRTVYSDSPAARAGLANGDELIAIDNWRVIADGAADWDYKERLEAMEPGDAITVTIGREGRLLEREVVLGVDESTVKLKAMAEPTLDQQARFLAWSGLPHPNASTDND